MITPIIQDHTSPHPNHLTYLCHYHGHMHPSDLVHNLISR